MAFSIYDRRAKVSTYALPHSRPSRRRPTNTDKNLGIEVNYIVVLAFCALFSLFTSVIGGQSIEFALTNKTGFENDHLNKKLVMHLAVYVPNQMKAQRLGVSSPVEYSSTDHLHVTATNSPHQATRQPAPASPPTLCLESSPMRDPQPAGRNSSMQAMREVTVSPDASSLYLDLSARDQQGNGRSSSMQVIREPLSPGASSLYLDLSARDRQGNGRTSSMQVIREPSLSPDPSSLYLDPSTRPQQNINRGASAQVTSQLSSTPVTSPPHPEMTTHDLPHPSRNPSATRHVPAEPDSPGFAPGECTRLMFRGSGPKPKDPEKASGPMPNPCLGSITYPLYTKPEVLAVTPSLGRIPPPRTFAILEVPAGILPWKLDTLSNWKSVMGNSWIDWFTPLRHSPCAKHDRLDTLYPVGPDFANLKKEAGLAEPLLHHDTEIVDAHHNDARGGNPAITGTPLRHSNDTL